MLVEQRKSLAERLVAHLHKIGRIERRPQIGRTDTTQQIGYFQISWRNFIAKDCQVKIRFLFGWCKYLIKIKLGRYSSFSSAPLFGKVQSSPYF